MLSIDVQFGVRTLDIVSSTSHNYVQKFEKRLEWAYATANEVVKREQERHKQRYEHKVRCAKLMVGDKVLLRRTAFKGKHKI